MYNVGVGNCWRAKYGLYLPLMYDLSPDL